MKSILPLVFLAVFSLSAAAFDQITILPTRKKLTEDKGKNKGNTTIQSQEIAYDVKVTSKAFEELKGVTIKYNIFYEIAQPGVKGDGEVKTSSGSHTIPSLLTNKPVEFATVGIKLEKSTLDPGWYYGGGASAISKDKVVGIWFKAFDADGKLIGAYINPTTASKKFEWKE